MPGVPFLETILRQFQGTISINRTPSTTAAVDLVVNDDSGQGAAKLHGPVELALTGGQDAHSHGRLVPDGI